MVFRELLHGVRVVVVRRGCVNRGPAVLWGRPRGRVVHVGRHLTHDVSRRRGDRRRGGGHRRGRGLVVHHMRRPGALRWVLHGVTDWRRGRRRRTEVLLGRGHHVVGVGHYRRLRRVVPGVVMGWLRGSGGVLPGRGGVVLNGHRDQIAVLSSRDGGDSESLGAQSRGWGWAVVSVRRRLAIRVVWPVLERVREVDMVLGKVRGRDAVTLRDVGGRRRREVEGLRAAGGGFCGPHVAVVDVSLEVPLG